MFSKSDETKPREYDIIRAISKTSDSLISACLFLLMRTQGCENFKGNFFIRKIILYICFIILLHYFFLLMSLSVNVLFLTLITF